MLMMFGSKQHSPHVPFDQPYLNGYKYKFRPQKLRVENSSIGKDNCETGLDRTW